MSVPPLLIIGYCSKSKSERKTLDDEIARLKEEIAALKKQISMLQEQLL